MLIGQLLSSNNQWMTLRLYLTFCLQNLLRSPVLVKTADDFSLNYLITEAKDRLWSVAMQDYLTVSILSSFFFVAI